ncbi:Nuclear pore complex protein NUP1 [Striga hermonthica]|uniref:Nuclear pore complex protein NUP1 n=1 Tax=Striga hermonthica TaxID=68872 RepID=A0A9N7N8S3_STRHE|nr:Nuclear pore complex protein NUP1 [Striga hermonthica]
MTTADEGGATFNPTSSAYGGGGAGGKLRNKPFRRPTTPYDRPLTALRGNNDNNRSWLKKLVVEPASKLISYGADRLLAPLLRKRLPPTPPPQPPEAKADVKDGIQGAVLNSHDGPQEPLGGDYSQPINDSSSSDFSQLEQLMKQRTFTRSEIVHLRKLLQSRVAEVSLENVGRRNEDTALDYARDQQFASGLLEENGNERNRSSTFMSTSFVNSKVVENDNASPAEIAKAYMGSRPSKVSPSVLAIRSRVGKGDAGLLSSLSSASGSPIMALNKKTHNSMVAPDNGFITPRSRGRSAIYNMARTPYSKVHLTSSLKGSGISRNGYAGPGPSTSSSFPPVDIDENFDSRPTSLKRRGSVLDDELGSIGPIRRIRQKPNLLASGRHNTTPGVVTGSHAKQKFPLIDEQSHKASKDVGENENETVPIPSFPHVPSKSSEVASKILQHLEKMTPKEKSSERKLVARNDKSPSTLTASMLSGQAIKSIADVDSSKLLNFQEDQKLGDGSNVTLADAHNFCKQKEEKVVENGPIKYVPPLDKWYPASNNDSVVSLKASMPSTSGSGSLVKTGASHPQKKRVFRMSAQEDPEPDDNTYCNGTVSRSISENKGPMEDPLPDSRATLSEEPKLVKPSIKAENQSVLPLNSRNKSAPNYGTVAPGEMSTIVSLSTSEETKEASQSVIPLSVAEKPNAPLFSFSSKVVEKVASLPSGSIREMDATIKSPSCLVNTPPTGSEVKDSESDKSSMDPFKAGDANGKSDNIPSTTSIRPSPASFTTTSGLSNDTNQIFKGGNALQFDSSTSGGCTSTSTSTSTPAAPIFGLAAAKPSFPASTPVFNFGASDPITSVPAASTTRIAQSELNPKANESETTPSSLNSAAASSTSDSTTFGLGSPFSLPASHTSVFASAIKSPLASLFSTASQGTSSTAQPVSTFSSSSTSTPFCSSSISQVSKPSNSPIGVKFGANTTEANAVSSTSSTPPIPGIFPFGLSSSTSSIADSSSAPSSSAPSNSNPFAASLQGPKQSPVFGSSNTLTSGFSFGALPSSSAPSTNVFNSSSSFTASFSFPAAPSSPASAVFGGVSQVNAEDRMAEDHPVQQQQLPFGQPGVAAATPPAFAFGQFGQPSPFLFSGQQPNQIGVAAVPQNPNPFQASASLEFNAGGSFSLGSGGGDKSGRKIVKISRSKNRKK